MTAKRGAIIDLDGTVYRGDRLLPGADDGIDTLRSTGFEVLFLTNSSLDRPATIAEKLGTFGIDAGRSTILTSGVITASYLAENYPDDRPLVIGEPPLTEELEQSGLAPTRDPDEASVLVVSLDRDIDYRKLTLALRTLDEDTTFVCTNPDRVRPGEDGMYPSTRAIAGAVEGMTGRSPDLVTGKPSEIAARVGRNRIGVPPADCYLIGDRLDTDIAMGNDAGLRTVLVETGVTSRPEAIRSSIEPDFILDSLANVDDVIG